MKIKLTLVLFVVAVMWLLTLVLAVSLYVDNLTLKAHVAQHGARLESTLAVAESFSHVSNASLMLARRCIHRIAKLPEPEIGPTVREKRRR